MMYRSFNAFARTAVLVTVAAFNAGCGTAGDESGGSGGGPGYIIVLPSAAGAGVMAPPPQATGGASGMTSSGGASGGTGGTSEITGGAPGAGGTPSFEDAGSGGLSANDAGSPSSSPCAAMSTAVPDDLRARLNLHSFYTKYMDAEGIPILSSSAPEDRALTLACELVIAMVSERPDVKSALIENGARFGIVGRNEGTAEIPEYGYRDRSQADKDWFNWRARGAATIIATCGEENILCLEGDRYYNESICIHEFAHTISMYGLFDADDTFEGRLSSAWSDAMASGVFDNTYRTTSVQEYWAEGVQDYYDTNVQSIPANGVHNSVNTRAELLTADPTLHALIAESFPENLGWPDCHNP